MTFMFDWLRKLYTEEQNTNDSDSKSKVRVNVKGSIIECMTLMCYAAGKIKTLVISDNLINLLCEIQTNGFKLDDNTNEYIIAGWQRLISILGSDFSK